MARIIAISGAHGTGKTTTVFRMAEWLKRRSREPVSVMHELSRECPLPICGRAQDGTEVRAGLDAQWWIFGRQLTREMEAMARPGWLVSDRGIADVIAYTAALGFRGAAHAMVNCARESGACSRYAAIIFRPIAECDYLVDDGARSMDRAFRKEVESLMLSAWADLGCNLVDERDALAIIGPSCR